MKERPSMRNTNVLHAQIVDVQALRVLCYCPHCWGQIESNFSHDIGRCPHCLQIVYWEDLVTPEMLDSLNMALSYKVRESEKGNTP